MRIKGLNTWSTCDSIRGITKSFKHFLMVKAKVGNWRCCSTCWISIFHSILSVETLNLHLLTLFCNRAPPRISHCFPNVVYLIIHCLPAFSSFSSPLCLLLLILIQISSCSVCFRWHCILYSVYAISQCNLSPAYGKTSKKLRPQDNKQAVSTQKQGSQWYKSKGACLPPCCEWHNDF